MNIVGINNMSKEGERRRCLPLEIRLQMYENVIELRKQGLTQKEIQEIIYEKYEMRLSQSTISTWINRKTHPLGRVNKFNGESPLELMYVIGTIFGDGNRYLYSKNEQCLLRLAVKDYEFAEEFGRCLAKVLGRKEPYKPFWDKNEKIWIVEGYSILLYDFLNKPFEELKPYIEYSKETVASFLRALFDGEGSIHGRTLRLYNTNKELLNYTKYLLKEYFNIDATGPHLSVKSGTITRTPNGNCKRNKDCYYLHLRAKSLLNFYKYIGFTIQRKQRKLIEAIQ
ncbi:MAG: LAGLIDADG family homing endonuclease [Nitrososphaerota archaeon]